MNEIEIICNVPEDEDEKGAGGLWDLAGKIAETAGLAAKKYGSTLRKTIYAEDFGQDEIYYILRDLVRE